MSWFKESRNWGQIPFADPTEGTEDPWARNNPDYPEKKKKKDALQESPGMGTETHNSQEESGNGTDLNQIDSLTSGYQIENSLYNGEVMEETPTGATLPRTDFQGDSGDASTLGGEEDDGGGSFLLRQSPNERSPEEEKRNTFLRSLKRPSQKRNVNGHDINIL
jgi:hypothetical protein